jgi:DNA-binding Lrp family transcriptional regulator
MNSKKDQLSSLLDQDLASNNPERSRRKVSEVLARMSGPRPAKSDGPSKIDTLPDFDSLADTDSPSETVRLIKINESTELNSLSNPDRLAKTDSPSKFTSPSKSAREAIIDSLSFFDEVAPQNDSPSKIDGLSEIQGASAVGSPAKIAALSYSRRPEFSLLNSLSDAVAHMPLFHQMTDYLDRQLSPSEQAVYRQLFRLTWGFQRPTVVIGNGKLAERSNVGETTVRTVLKALEAKGLVRKVRMIFGSNQEQGNEWEVFAPLSLVRHLEERERRRRPSKSDTPSKFDGPPKSDDMKENVLSSKEHTQTQAGVSVSSRFSLEECRRYADHLKATGQGIINPGGYATKIFRSGEADAFIEAFLNPQAQTDISKCLDCKGTGFIYMDPSNHDKGVRPCKHDHIRSSA